MFMKKTGLKQLMIVSLLAASGVMVHSCSKTEKPVSGSGTNSVNEKTSILTSADALDFTGEIHNAGMDAALASGNYSNASDNEKYNFFIAFTRGEFVTRSLPNDGITEIDEETYLPHLRNTSVADLYDEAYESLTDNEQTVMDQMESIIEITNKETRKSQITSLKSTVYASTTLSEDEKIFLLASISIATNSAEYWDSHPGDVAGLGKGVWKADWQGFWYGYHSSETNQTWGQQIETGLGTAQLASEFKRLENS
ncbi:MAG: hypothetical protein A3D31_03250 [Candidatus Fluviicola riflensis]|nr:MAG: hypothetical protein CHH17_11780 [Candidatus Fluviicola riflensis]OGS79000.1 MAG: hypothetical protein A3D31_03250 [Candidatus Fluviicola riflensis]OGS86023.1 MAG: hypothetical protein A3E30_10740 [Fluviicola sp. RIFCSPHIGHO2_12_FULL_43_24]OGS86432.1 MAG: hypothetical protein A2724_02710 [Fluviicola sp. RIFCSPHIGHO2_01_FULL_43_53]